MTAIAPDRTESYQCSNMTFRPDRLRSLMSKTMNTYTSILKILLFKTDRTAQSHNSTMTAIAPDRTGPYQHNSMTYGPDRYRLYGELLLTHRQTHRQTFVD